MKTKIPICRKIFYIMFAKVSISDGYFDTNFEEKRTRRKRKKMKKR